VTKCVTRENVRKFHSLFGQEVSEIFITKKNSAVVKSVPWDF